MTTATKTKFAPGQFTATEHATTADKAKFANHFIRFVLGGFKESVFPKWFYTRLSMTFGHIAHYNKNGFYDTWFNSADKQANFIERLREHTACGSAEFTFSDVERVLTRWANDNADEINAVVQANIDADADANNKERQRLNTAAESDEQQFKVVAKSDNTGSFGHYQYIVMAQDGSSYNISIIPSNRNLSQGDTITTPLKDGRPTWAGLNVECPTRVGDAPQSVIDEVWN